MPLHPPATTETAWLLKIATRLASPAEAEDLAQDTWLTALEQGPDPSRSRRPWLRTVVGRAAASARRRRARWAQNAWRLEHEDSPPPIESRLHRANVLSAVKSAIDDLEATDRDIVLRRFFREEDTADVARALGLNPGAVRTRLSRALSRVRESLDDDFGGRKAWGGALLLRTGIEPQPATSTATLALAFAGVAAVGAAAVALGTQSDSAEPASIERVGSEAVLATESEVPPVRATRDTADEIEVWSGRRRSIKEAHRDPANPITRAAPGPEPIARTSTGAAEAFKTIAAELRDVTATCVDSLPEGSTGKLGIGVRIIAEQDIGAIVDEIKISSDDTRNEELLDCVTNSIPAFHVPAVRTRIDQVFQITVDVSQRSLAAHSWLVVDDLPAHLADLRAQGMPPKAVEARREAVQKSPGGKIRTGWRMMLDPQATNAE